MLTTILITVFSTLGATALISFLFFLHVRINNRVKKDHFSAESNDLRVTIDSIYDTLSERHEKDFARLNANIDEQYKMLRTTIDDVYEALHSSSHRNQDRIDDTFNQVYLRLDELSTRLNGTKSTPNSPAEPHKPVNNN
jgi:hypothetical protein